MWTGKQRLEALATYLETTDFEAGKFHMGAWMSSYRELLHNIILFDPWRAALSARCPSNDDEMVFERGEGNTLVPIECKTTGCALGWGAVGIPEFKEQGLKLTYWRYNVAVVSYEGYTDFAAAQAFFKIPSVTASHLFSPTSYELFEQGDPKAVAKRIRTYLMTV